MKFISDSATRALGKKVLQIKKQSPHIFFAGGIIGVVGGTVLACRATLKLESTLDEIKEDVDAVKTRDKSKLMDGGEPYSDHDYYKDLGYVYGKSFVKLGRLYGPSVVVGAISITALTGSHVQLTRRNTALTATLAAVSTAYEEYRMRVREEIGEERERDLYFGTHTEEIENEEGKKEKIEVSDPSKFSPYARLFDEANINWEKSPSHNRTFLNCQENYFNHRLRAKGHVFLNEVYDALGFDRTQEGCVVGWVMDDDGPGDNFVDFGLQDERNGEFMRGYERSVWLDFNVDGVVYDRF